MRILASAEIEAAISHRGMIEAMRNACRGHTAAPPRQRYRVERPDRPASDIVISPAWTDFLAAGHSGHGYQGVKIMTDTPGNRAEGLPERIGTYLLLSGKTGVPLAMIDGRVLTYWRTAATCALASSYLARADSGRLLMLGAGGLAPYLIEAHAAVRPLNEVLIWNRTPEAADRLAAALRRSGLRVSATRDLEGAVRGADIVSCAADVDEPLVRAAWIAPGTHLDLAGGRNANACGVDADTLALARLFIDSREGLEPRGADEAGAVGGIDLRRREIAADLFELARGEKSGRRFHDQVTLFRCCGNAAQDLAGAVHIFTQL